MNTKYDHIPGHGAPIVYIRPVALDELPQELRAQAEAGGVTSLYAVHDANGERLALVNDRRLAFGRAHHHDMAPVNVH